MDKDFKDRKVLNLITYNKFAPLLSDGKVAVLLDNLWQGKLTTLCDGRIDDYSKITVMATASVRRLPK